MRYKIVHEDDKHFKMEHPDGSNFIVAKKGLNPELVSKIQKMCAGGVVKMADGGEVPDSLAVDAPTDLNQLTGAPLQMAENNTVPNLTPQLNQAPSPQSEMPIDASPMPQPNQADPSQMPPLPASKGMDQMMSGIQQTANAKTQEGQRDSQAYKQYADQMAQMQAQHQQERAKIDQDQARLMQQYNEGKIDPNRLWDNKSTGNKIGAVLSIILGGMGAGLTHGPNQALAVLDDQINKDIDSQKANLNKTQSLMSMNMEKYRNLDAAETATRLQYNTMLQAQLGQSAARAGSQQAQGNAQMAIGQLQAQKDQLSNQLAQQMMSLRAADPIGRQIRTMVPEKEQGKVMDEVKQAQNAIKMKDSLMSEFDKADKQNTLLGRATHLGFSPQSVANMKNMIMPVLKDNEGRVNETELERTDAFIPAPGDSPAKIAEKKKGLLDFLEAKSAMPTANAYGIKLSGGAYDDRGNKRIQESAPNLK